MDSESSLFHTYHVALNDVGTIRLPTAFIQHHFYMRKITAHLW